MKRILTPLAAAASALALAFAPAAQAGDAPAPAPSPEAPAPTPETAPPQARPALWKVADEDTTIWLFGTVHALPEGIDWYHGPVARALGESEMLVTEIEMTAETAASMKALVTRIGTLPEGQSLRAMLNAKQRTVYEDALARLGLPAAAFDPYEPWYAAMMLGMLPLLKEGYSPAAGVETVLQQARGEEMPRGALETLEEQLAIFDSLPMEAQVRLLIETAEGVDDIKAMLDLMVAEWAEGDAAELARLINESMSDPVLAERLLYRRNANWARWIDERLDRPGTVFLAVGAGHLAGTQSVQDKLAELGIATARVQ